MNTIQCCRCSTQFVPAAGYDSSTCPRCGTVNRVRERGDFEGLTRPLRVETQQADNEKPRRLARLAIWVTYLCGAFVFYLIRVATTYADGERRLTSLTDLYNLVACFFVFFAMDRMIR